MFFTANVLEDGSVQLVEEFCTEKVASNFIIIKVEKECEQRGDYMLRKLVERLTGRRIAKLPPSEFIAEQETAEVISTALDEHPPDVQVEDEQRCTECTQVDVEQRFTEEEWLSAQIHGAIEVLMCVGFLHDVDSERATAKVNLKQHLERVYNAFSVMHDANSRATLAAMLGVLPITHELMFVNHARLANAICYTPSYIKRLLYDNGFLPDDDFISAAKPSPSDPLVSEEICNWHFYRLNNVAQYND